MRPLCRSRHRAGRPPDKAIVQPFGEYLPMPWLFRHLSATPTAPATSLPNGTGVVRWGPGGGYLLGGDLRPRGSRFWAARGVIDRT